MRLDGYAKTIGIVGYGSAGQRARRLLVHRLGIPEGLITVFDVRDKAGEVDGVKVIGDGVIGDGAGLRDQRALIICTPAHAHVFALENRNRQALFIEKPVSIIKDIGVTAAEVNRSEVLGLTGIVGYNMRFHPAVVAARKWVRAREYPAGIVLKLACHTNMATWPGQDYGSVTEECSHEIDMALHLLGPGKVTQCAGDRYRTGRRLISIAHDCGAFTFVDLNGGSANYLRTLHASDNKGLFGWATTNFAKAGDMVVTEGGAPPAFSFVAPAWTTDDMYAATLEDFLQHETIAPRGCTLRQGLEVLRLCKAAEEMP